MNKDITPKVSVIVPNYNYAHFLEIRINSILSQTYQDYELILLDDCSTDESKSILESYRHNPKVSAIVYNEKNSGSPFIQWEKGINMARGEFVWMAESDDVADPSFLATLMTEIDNHPQSIIAYSHSFLIDNDGNLLSRTFHDKNDDNRVVVYKANDFIEDKLLWGCHIYNVSMAVFRRDLASNIPKYYKDYRAKGDWMFWICLCLEGGKVVEIRNRLNMTRIHSNSTTSCLTQEGRDWEECGDLLNRIVDITKMSLYLRIIFKGRWSHNLRISNCTYKDKLKLRYPRVFGAPFVLSLLVRIYCRLLKRK